MGENGSRVTGGSPSPDGGRTGLTNERPDLCVPCGGMCCSMAPGIGAPADFGTTREEVEKGLREAIETGRWTFDAWDADSVMPETFYPRPAQVGFIGRIVHRPWNGGQCGFLTPQGCELPFWKRPFGCRDLLPLPWRMGWYVPDCRSESGSSKAKEVRAWRPYQDIIKGLIREAELREAGY